MYRSNKKNNTPIDMELTAYDANPAHITYQKKIWNGHKCFLRAYDASSILFFFFNFIDDKFFDILLEN
jgi:hypothetical protein